MHQFYIWTERDCENFCENFHKKKKSIEKMKKIESPILEKLDSEHLELA